MTTDKTPGPERTPGGPPGGPPGGAGAGTPSPDATAGSEARNTTPTSGTQGAGTVSLPTVALPKGGGAIRGIGEKFSVNASTGTGSLSVPIAVSPGRSGFTPQLNLSYDSGSGNGPFGFGWSLGLPSVTRKVDKGMPRYDDNGESDVFILSGAEDLVPILDNAGNRIRFQRIVHGVTYQIAIYRPRTEGMFARIERWMDLGTGLTHWRSISRENVTTLYGYDADSRIADPSDPRKIFSYLICRTFDDKGNVSRYEYLAEDDRGVNHALAHEMNRPPAARATQRYIKRIRYGNTTPWYADWSAGGSEPALPSTWYFEVVFDYGDHASVAPVPTPDRPWVVRPDPFSSYRSGFEVRTYRRCERVLQFHHFTSESGVGANCLVHAGELLYSDEVTPADPTNPIYTFLASFTHTGYRRNGSGYESRSTPPLEFEYSTAQLRADVLSFDIQDLETLPEGVDGTRHQFVDLNGEGLSGILTDFGSTWGYRRNLSPLNEVTLPNGSRVARAKFGPLEEVPRIPSQSELTGQARLMDLSADGQLDLVSLEERMQGFYERTPDGGWSPFQRFASLPQIDWSDPNLRFIDLTGDGLADVLITDDGVFTVYQSLGEAGFGDLERIVTGWDEDQGPHVVFADGAQTVFLADMSGDGLSDLVRVRNADICYWPNLGYGRFGSRVVMDNAPRFTDQERFDPKRIRLSDIDGSGTTDVLYVGEDGVVVCFNRSGNTWSEARCIAVFPTTDSPNGVQMLDLLGNGTACLVWSSPLPSQASCPMKYVDLMGSVKPHLLVTTRNNLGSETRIRYAPSTRFYLEDMMAGRPWITRLPHVVQVVERTEIYDFIGRSRFVTRYAYHHGYFDGEEREFRGFGMVEQWDTEEHRDDTLFPESPTTNWDAISWTPPLLTRTWFHTGAFVESGSVSRHYSEEYWTEPTIRGSSPAEIAAREALLLPDTVLPGGLTADEEREACRALKSTPLRIEVYSEDGTSQAEHPYSVTEQNSTILFLQPRGPNRHAVFFVHQREAVHYNYERQPSDPRITHEITLTTDDFGNPLRKVSTGYGRRAGYSAPEPTLSLTFQTMLAHDQTRLHVGGTEQVFTTPVNRPWDATSIDAYRAPMPCETLTAELTGITPASERFTFAELDGHWSLLWGGTHDIPYEQVTMSDIDGTGASTGLARRIVSQTRTLYRRNDLNGLLALGALESQAIPGESYQLALTQSQLGRIFGSTVNSTILGEGGYVQLSGSTGWWIPSGRVFLSPNDTDTAAQELTEARAHFYQPRRAVDPFGSVTRITYDAYDLHTRQSSDPVGLVTSADNDYRVLQAYRIVDVNGNTNELAFDCLGAVTGMATYGKAGEGDTLAGFDADLTEVEIQSIRGNPLGSPGATLGSATSRIVHDLFAYHRTRALASPEPPMVYTVTRETHVSDIPPGGGTAFRHLLVYCDGFGREVQHKALGEPGPVPGVGTNVSPRWIGSGWTIFNNKGKAVRKYEPFFTSTHEFEFDRQVGVSAVVHYDPLDRPVATLFPDSSFEKTIFGAWQQTFWDRNDTSAIGDPRTDSDVGDFFTRLLGSAPGAFTSWYDRRIGGTLGATSNERAANMDAAQKAHGHAGTPTVTHFDALGRHCLKVLDNGTIGGVAQRYPTRTALDTESKPLAVIDAKERHIAEFSLREPSGGSFVYVDGYDMAGRLLYYNGADGGQRRALHSVLGEPIRVWTERGFTFRMLYDPLRRLTHRYVDQPGSGETLAERFIYGDRHATAALNLKGRLFRHYDGAGVASFDGYDFKGNLTRSGRQLALHSPSTTTPPGVDRSPDWSTIATITDTPTLNVTAIDTATSSLLDPADAFIASTRFDAVNRPIQMVTPHVATGRPSVVQPTYNQASEIETIDVWIRQSAAPSALLSSGTADIHAVTDIDYNARGQRTEITLGNGSVTTYQYDADTFRLVSLVTARPDPDPDARTVQALSYTYDPIGNVTRLRDDADIHNVVFFRNRRVDPTADYTYDPIYRLITATGREHLGLSGTLLNPSAQPTNDDGFRMRISAPGDGNAVDTYTESYTYDPVGNLLTMVHQVASGGWTRRYGYNEPSRVSSTETGNRLSATSMPGDPTGGPYSATYRYDAHGNMTRMPHLPEMTWDICDRLQSTTRQVVGSGMPETTYYQYEAGGARIRKVTYRQAASGVTPKRKSERIYLGGFEIYREYDTAGSTVMLERESLSVMVGEMRALLIETRTIDVAGTDPAPAQMIRYQYGNLIGSATLELDASAGVISYEEYFPYGSTSYQAVRSATDTPKRYRYSGKERDEENDLAYHGARYYAPWLGRWTACDPILLDWMSSRKKDWKALEMYFASSPYAYGFCNPTKFIDPDGRENIVVVGSQHEQGTGNKMNFVHQGLSKLIEYEKNQSKESRTMVLFKYGYTDKQIAEIRKAVEAHGGKLVEVDSIQQLANYVNTGSKDGKKNTRSKDLITNMDMFSHGVVGSVDFGYDTPKADAYRFDEKSLKLFSADAFSRAALVVSYACRTGLGDGSEVGAGNYRWSTAFAPRYYDSFAQKLADKLNVTVMALPVRSDYSGTLGTHDDRHYDSKSGHSPALDASLARRKANGSPIDGADFDPNGALHPVGPATTPRGIPKQWRTYKPMSKAEEDRLRQKDDAAEKKYYEEKARQWDRGPKW